MATAKELRVQKVRNALDVSYSYCEPYMRDAKRLLKAYFNEIDEDEWQTLSECRIPLEYSQVDTLLSTIMDYVFHGGKKVFKLIPEDALDDDTVQKLERFLDFKLKQQVDFKNKIQTIIRSALTVPCGYGLVERVQITPPVSESLAGLTGGGQLVSEDIIQAGTPVDTANFRYIDFFSVFPAPFGATPEDVDYVIIVDFLDEFTVESGIKEEILKGDMKTIKDKSHIMASYMDGAMAYAKYASDPQNNTLRGIDQNADGFADIPRRIPVVKYYGKDEIIWLVEDEEIYYHKRGKEILTNPLVKISAIPVNDMWFSPSPLHYTSDLCDLINIFVNSIIDTISYFLSPPIVLNRQLIPYRDEVDRRPNGTIETTGNPSQAVSFLNPPPLPSGLMSLQNDFRGLLDSTSGLPEVLKGQGGAGIVRGGSGALQSLLQTAGARSTMMAENIINSGVKPAIQKIWYLLQNLPETSETVTFYDEDNQFQQEQVSNSEIRHVMRVDIISGKQMMNKFADVQMRLQAFPVLVQAGVPVDKAVEWMLPDEDIRELFGQGGVQPPMGVEGIAGQGQGQQGGQGALPNQLTATGGV